MPYKLEWLRVLEGHAKQWLQDDPDAQIALVGDWNVAPQDDDVWDIQLFKEGGYTHVSEPERAAFHAFIEDSKLPGRGAPAPPRPRRLHLLGLQAAALPQEGGHAHRLPAVLPALAARVQDAWIDRDERKGKGASDHAPVVIEID